MKKLNIILFLIGCLFVFASCSDDDQTIDESPLKIVKSNLVFAAVGGSGTVTATSSTPISSATSSDDWCKVSVASDTTVSVTVAAYQGDETRNALITIKDGNDNEVHIAAAQSGNLFYLGSSMMTMPDAAGTDYMKMKHTYPAVASTSADWLTVSVTGDSLKFDATANTTGNIRTAVVYVENLGKKDSVTVNQYDMTDIEGTYYFLGNDPSTDKLVYVNSTLKDKGDGTLTLAFPDLKLTADVAFDEATLTYKLIGGTYFGTYADKDASGAGITRYIYVDLWDAKLGYITWSSSCSYNCRFFGSKGHTLGVFEDNGSWSGYSVSALVFEKYKAQEATSANRTKTYLLRLVYPYMQKKTEAATEAITTEAATPVAF